jgi:hypothetical protein
MAWITYGLCDFAAFAEPGDFSVAVELVPHAAMIEPNKSADPNSL